jgi:hypothetical protein
MKLKKAIVLSGLCLTLGTAIHAKVDNVRGLVVNVTEAAVQVGLGKGTEGPPRAAAKTTASDMKTWLARYGRPRR